VEETTAMMRDTRSPGMIPMLRGFAEADLRDVLPGVGHSSNLEAPLAFNAAVRTFLERA